MSHPLASDRVKIGYSRRHPFEANPERKITRRDHLSFMLVALGQPALGGFSSPYVANARILETDLQRCFPPVKVAGSSKEMFLATEAEAREKMAELLRAQAY